MNNKKMNNEKSATPPSAKLYPIELTDEQVSFLLYVMGYMLAASDGMDDGHKYYIEGHHWAIMPKLIGATKRVSPNAPSPRERAQKLFGIVNKYLIEQCHYVLPAKHISELTKLLAEP